MSTRVYKIVLVGAGNVATQMGYALQQAGHEISAVYSRTVASASQLAACLDSSYTTAIEKLPTDSDLYILALKDDSLATILPELIKGRETALFLHTAGSLPMSLFDGLVSNYGVFYPLQTFSKLRKVDFCQIALFVEADSEATLAIVEELAYTLTPKVYRQTSEQRSILHLSAVFACNFVNHCYTLAAQQLEKQAIPFEVLLPLIEETTAKLYQLTPIEAQTGPAVRYDTRIIKAQMNLLANNPPVQQLYELMSQSIHRAALAQNNEK